MEGPPGIPEALSSRVTPLTPGVWAHVVCAGPLPVPFRTPLLAHTPTDWGHGGTRKSRTLAATRPSWSAQRPSLVFAAATSWPSPCHGWGQAAARAGVRSHAGGKNCRTHGTERAAAAGPPPPCRGWAPVARPRRHAGGCSG